MTDTQTPMLSLYDELKSRGVNLDWYDKRKHPKLDGNIPLENERCSRLSIYLLKQDGSLWTVTSDGEAYSQVRDSKQAVPRDVYVCLCCKAQWAAMPADHKEDNS
jgi:hypothetical protein